MNNATRTCTSNADFTANLTYVCCRCQSSGGENEAENTIISLSLTHDTHVLRANPTTFDVAASEVATIRYVRSTADMSRLNLPHGNDN